MKELHKTVQFTQAPALTENPLESIHISICTSSKDMSLDKRDAWQYGIAVGWDDASYKELALKHNWSVVDIERNKRLHQKYIDAWVFIQNAAL